ncbi:MAG TPA: hypothetical protein VG520_08360 [Candidatus Dormibacteraeota bacterium]|jgi:hypothetical protein|nr:hypothetical protein [Candidatus Dormibacteraeota bacterium]
MRPPPTVTGLACATLLVAALAGCGSDTQLPQAPSTSPFSTGAVSITQRGNAAAVIDTSSATFKLDDAGTLVAHLSVRSTAATTVTLIIRGSIYDPQHRLVGDVTGGQVDVAPGSTAPVQLTGPAPVGTIASAVFELTAPPSPT